MSDPHAGHDHTPKVTAGNETKMLIALAITFSFMIVEIVGGLMAGSLALIADAGHMFTDVVALSLAYFAFRFGRRAADEKRTFGYMRFEVIAGLINAVTLFAILIWITYEAIERFRNPGEVLAGPMFIVATVGLLINMLVFWILTRGGDTEQVNIKGAVLHVLGDLLGSVGTIVAAIVIYYTGWTPIDPILSVFVSILILRSAWALLRNSLHILLEGAPDNAAPEAIEQYLKQTVPGLAAVRHVHVWMITSGKPLATLHVRPAPDTNPRLLVKQVEAELMKKFEISHSTIAIDWPEDTATDDCCLGDDLQQGHEHDHSGHAHDEADHDHSGHDHAAHEHGHEGHKH